MVSLYNVTSSYDSTLRNDKHADFDTALSYFQNKGIITKDEIDGDKPISRLEAVKLLMKTLGLFKEIKLPQTNENAFKDLNKMNGSKSFRNSEWAYRWNIQTRYGYITSSSYIASAKI